MPFLRSKRPPATRRLALTLVAALCCLAALPASAGAHAHLLFSSPADGDVLQQAPETVRLQFGGTVVAGADSVQVFGPDERRVDRDAPTPRKGMRITQAIDASMPGTYGVAYRVSSEDGHVITGAITFSVGSATTGTHSGAGASADAARVDRSLQVAFSSIRLVEVLALLVASGSGIFSCLLAPRWRPRLLVAALVTVLLAYAAGFLVNAAILHGSVAQGLTVDALRDTARTPFGLSLQIRAVVAAVAIPPAVLLRSNLEVPVGARRVLAVVFLGVAASLSITGHAVTTEPIALRLPMDMLHVAAAAVWIGGLVQLAFLAPFAHAHLDAIRRFSRTAFGCVVALLVSGLYATYAELGVDDLGLLTSSEYGRLITAKSLLLAGTVPLAWNNMRTFLPALEQRPHDSSRMLRHYVRRELVLLVVVVALTVWLIATPQP